MLEFYIKENGSFVKKDIIIPATITETFDETLDSAEVVLALNDIETPYTPDTRCYFYDGTNIISNMIIVSDNVERATHGIAKYKHTLQLTQNTRLLQKHLVRNSSFSQPRDKYKKQLSLMPYYGGQLGTKPTGAKFQNTIIFDYKEKPVVNDNEGIIKCSIKTYSSSKTSSAMSGYDEPTNFLSFEYYDDTANPILFEDNDDVIFQLTITYSDSTTTTFTKTHKAYENIVNIENAISINYTLNPNKTLSSMKVDIITPAGATYKNMITLSAVSGTQVYWNGGIHLSAKVETYIWSMYDVLLTLRNQYFLDTDLRSTTDADKQAILYGLPDNTTEFGKILRNTIAPNFTFTGATFYECLAEIFKYYDAIFTLDQNNILGIEYLNEYNRNKIVATFSNKLSTFSEENFTTGYVSYFENALAEETFTSKLRFNELGVSNETETNWQVILPHEIQSIIKAEMFIPSGSFTTGEYGSIYFNNLWVDITDFLLSSDIYATLKTYTDYSQMNEFYKQAVSTCFSYSGKNIVVGGNLSKYGYNYKHLKSFVYSALIRTFVAQDTRTITIGDSFGDYRNFKIKLTYKTKVDGRIKLENEIDKYKGETIVNQSNGAVDLNKMGLNMLGLSYKLGQPTLGMTQNITTWANRIRKGQIYEYNNERWLANVVKYQIYNDNITCNINFIKNYNALSQRIQVDRQKRLSQISNELTVKSEDNYCEYIYLSSQDIQDDGDSLILETTSVRKGVLDTFSNVNDLSGYKVDFACITPFIKTDTNIYRYDRYANSNVAIERVFIPLIKYPSGNAICFEMSMDSPITAGIRTHFTDNNAGYSDNGLYTENGWVDKLTIQLCQYKNDFDDDFPYIASGNYYQAGYIQKLQYYKKPNEILALNYELLCLVPPTRKGIDFIGNQFVKSSGFISDGNKIAYLYFSTSEIYSPFDLKGIQMNNYSPKLIRYNSTTVGVYDFKMEFFIGSLPSGIKSWSICDSEGNILFASNDPTAIVGNYVYIYAYPKHTRL